MSNADYKARCDASGLVSDDVLHLVLPLTPSGNEILKWNYNPQCKWELKKYKSEILVSTKALIMQTMGVRRTPWAQRVSMCAIRCGERWVDCDNLISGLKYAIDGIVRCNVFPDDSPRHMELGMVQSRSRKEWGKLCGPATHIFLCRIARPSLEEYKRVLGSVFYFFEMEASNESGAD